MVKIVTDERLSVGGDGDEAGKSLAAETDAFGAGDDDGPSAAQHGGGGVRCAEVNSNGINCPRCGSRMIRTVDIDQPHIWFEHCTVCGGSFFDAGEFKDLNHHTIVDFFRDLLVKERE